MKKLKKKAKDMLKCLRKLWKAPQPNQYTKKRK